MMGCPSELEIWKPIPGYEGLYEASSFGRIRTAEGKTTFSSRYPVRVWAQRVLKPKVQKRKGGKQDQRVSLWKDGEETTQLVARLVAMSFLPMPFDKLTVNHINGDSMDNRIENLEWLTLQDNIRHGFQTGLYDATKKPVVLTSVDGHELRFPSMREADKYLGRCDGYTSEAIARHHYCHDICGVRYSVKLAQELSK